MPNEHRQPSPSTPVDAQRATRDHDRGVGRRTTRGRANQAHRLVRASVVLAVCVAASCAGSGSDASSGAASTARGTASPAQVDSTPASAPAVTPPSTTQVETTVPSSTVPATTTSTTAPPTGTPGPVVVRAIVPGEVEESAGPVVTDLDATSPDGADPLAVGDEVDVTSVIHTFDARVTIEFADGTTVEAWPGTSLVATSAEPDDDRDFVAAQLFLVTGIVDADVTEPESTFEIVTGEGTIVVEGSRVVGSCVGSGRSCFASLRQGRASIDPTFRIERTDCVLPDIGGLCLTGVFTATVDTPRGFRPAVTGFGAGRNAFGLPVGSSASDWYRSSGGTRQDMDVLEQVRLDLSEGGVGATYQYEQDGIFTTTAIDVLDRQVVRQGGPVGLSTSHLTTGPNYRFPNLGGGRSGPGQVFCDTGPDPQSNTPPQGLILLPSTQRFALDDVMSKVSEYSPSFGVPAVSEYQNQLRNSIGCDVEVVYETTYDFRADVEPGLYYVVPGINWIGWKTIDTIGGDTRLIDGAVSRLIVLD